MRKAMAVVVALGLGACAGGGGFLEAVPSNPQGVVDQRVAIMKSFVGALSTSGGYAQGKATAKDAQAKVASARAGADRLDGLFPRGTALGDKGVTKSRALSTIFSNRGDFDAKNAAMVRAFAALDAVLVRGAKGEVPGALNALKGTCGACHDKYRAADE
jgi:cytochrome c556